MIPLPIVDINNVNKRKGAVELGVSKREREIERVQDLSIIRIIPTGQVRNRFHPDRLRNYTVAVNGTRDQDRSPWLSSKIQRKREKKNSKGQAHYHKIAIFNQTI